jgi:hypothetical protein
MTPVQIRLTSIKRAVLPETYRRPKTRRRQGVAA